MYIENEPILKELYFVKVPLIYTYEDYELDTVGSHYNEFYSFNYNNGLFLKQRRPAYKDLTKCYLNILRISEICYDGGTVYFVNTSDMEKAFNNIETIIKKYKDSSSYSLNQQKDNNVNNILEKLQYLNKSIFDNNNNTIKKTVSKQQDRFGLDLSDDIPKLNSLKNIVNKENKPTVTDLRNKTINMRFIKMFNKDN